MSEGNNKPAPSDKPAARITEQDAREIIRNFLQGSGNQLDDGDITHWLIREGGRTLLNKLNSDREQVPSVAVYDLSPANAEGKIRDRLIAMGWAPPGSPAVAVADAERFCDSHCTWRDHHPDCPRHDSELSASPAPDDIDRLVEHAAVLSIGLRDDDQDLPTESWRSLPDHLQKAINEKTEMLDFANSEFDVGN